MKGEQGMSLLEVLLAMSIFAVVSLALISSMQGQANAIDRMRDKTFGLWVADMVLQSAPFPDDDATKGSASTGEFSFGHELWSWRSETDANNDDGTVRQTITIMLPNGQSSSLTRYQLLPDSSAHEHAR